VKLVTSLAIALACAPGWCAWAGPVAQSRTPPGIAVRTTYEGPVFVDAHGMTLYRMTRSRPCESKAALYRHPLQADQSTQFPVPLPDGEMRRACTQKHPPLLAPEDAKPVGKWTVKTREDGSKQWAYDAAPLYLSIKDKRPGDVNGDVPMQLGVSLVTWTAAFAPPPGAPFNVSTKRTFRGPALAGPTGRTLYYPQSNIRDLDFSSWQPFLAPEAGKLPDHARDWSIIAGPSGKQWAYKGNPLYSYLPDGDNLEGFQFFIDTFGGLYGRPLNRWKVALIQAAPQPPRGVTVQIGTDMLTERSAERRIYADSHGMTLYTMHCIDDSVDFIECDDVGDSPQYWTSFCGGEEQCQKTWRPLVANASEKTLNNVWSIVTINPRHPFMKVEGDALRVWAYRGRPVFTYAGDPGPGVSNGATISIAVQSAVMASVIPAYVQNEDGSIP